MTEHVVWWLRALDSDSFHALHQHHQIIILHRHHLLSLPLPSNQTYNMHLFRLFFGGESVRCHMGRSFIVTLVVAFLEYGLINEDCLTEAQLLTTGLPWCFLLVVAVYMMFGFWIPMGPTANTSFSCAASGLWALIFIMEFMAEKSG